MTDNNETLSPEIEPGQEQFKYFKTGNKSNPKKLCEYQYKDTDGELFSCTRPTLEACRSLCNLWITKKKLDASKSTH